MSRFENKKKIIMVDDNITVLSSGKGALIDDFDVFTVPSGEKLFALLERITPDIILLDVLMPGMGGFEVMEKLRKNPNTAEIPVIFLTSKSDMDSELKGLSMGAKDYIVKPFSPQLLKKRIEMHILVEAQKRELKNYNENLENMVEKKTQTALELQGTIFKTVAELSEYRDSISSGHIERTQKFLRLLTEALVEAGEYAREVEDWDIDSMLNSAQLHDVGKIAISDSILDKDGELLEEELEEYQSHTTLGVWVIDKIEKNTSARDFMKHARIFAGTHHESWDGSGYPNGLKGEEIPLQGRLLAVADAYDELRFVRGSDGARTHQEATAAIAKGAGKRFDPLLVSLFLSIEDSVAQAALAADESALPDNQENAKETH